MAIKEAERKPEGASHQKIPESCEGFKANLRYLSEFYNNGLRRAEDSNTQAGMRTCNVGVPLANASA